MCQQNCAVITSKDEPGESDLNEEIKYVGKNKTPPPSLFGYLKYDWLFDAFLTGVYVEVYMGVE